MRKYYTLAVREDGQWHPQFGAYSRMDVVNERDDMLDGHGEYFPSDMKIVTSGDTQAAIDGAIFALNNPMS